MTLINQRADGPRSFSPAASRRSACAHRKSDRPLIAIKLGVEKRSRRCADAIILVLRILAKTARSPGRLLFGKFVPVIFLIQIVLRVKIRGFSAGY
ncbi:MAG TPA: hypothetical protein VK438_04600 [Xanthobacteraceae bacterium]|nr:hypothetical protein [Xanthobacteraceae bacterium]